MNATLEAPQRVEDIHDGERYAEFIESEASASADELRAQIAAPAKSRQWKASPITRRFTAKF